MTHLTTRTRSMLAVVLALALLIVSSGRAAAVGVGVNVDGGSTATITQGGTVEMTWSVADAETVTARTTQDGAPVSFPAWDGPKAADPTNTQSLTVDLPPGSYFLIIEATDGQATAVSSVGLIVLADDDGGTTPVDPVDPVDPVEPTDPVSEESGADGADPTDVPTSAPHAGRP